MVLASSNEGDTVLDPFSGSGTTLRVCQQLKRNAIGFELNPEYVEMTHERLAQPFKYFDSIDPRMDRVPLDLRNEEIRNEYLENHIKWFLRHHEDYLDNFQIEVKKIYGEAKKTLF